MYWKNGGREVTIELSEAYNPPGSVLPLRWTNNKESFLAYMEQTLKGIRGTVTDAVTGIPLRARIDVIGISNAPVYTDSAIGDYHRLILPGTYSLIARAAGYVTDTAAGIVVTAGTATRVDIRLQPLPTTVVQPVTQDWNLLSLPLTVADARPVAVYPAATAATYAFVPTLGYAVADTLLNATGYWVKFGSAQNISIMGMPRAHDTIAVESGWNLIGGSSSPVPSAAVGEIPAGIVGSPYFDFNGTYAPSDTLLPGKGYWVKVTENGRLILR
jgi:hypothetical protein